MKTFVLLIALALLAVPAHADDADRANLPQIGAVAPAFGLYPFTTKAQGEDATGEKIELDDHCGMRPGDTKLVLLVFSNAVSLSSDLELADGWRRKHARDGFVPIIVSTDSDAQAVRETVARTRYSFPILNDSFRIVTARYGISSPPFSLLLDHGCRVMGLSDKSLSVDAERLSKTIDTVLSGKLGEIE